MAGFGLAAGAIFVMPAVTAFVASFFSDEIAAEVEHSHYPADPPGMPVSVWTAVFEGLKTGLLTLLVYLLAMPLLLFAGFGFLGFFVANATCSAGNISCSPRCASTPSRRRRRCASAIRHDLPRRLFIAVFVSIPILDPATPLFGMAFMTHMHKKIAGPRRELIKHT